MVHRARSIIYKPTDEPSIISTDIQIEHFFGLSADAMLNPLLRGDNRLTGAIHW